MAQLLRQPARNTLLALSGGAFALAVACTASNPGSVDLGTGADLSTSNPDLAAVAGTPQITGLTPGKASTLGGSTVTINGSGFVSGATVRLTLGATTVVVSSATVSADGMSLSFQAPANAGKPGLYDVAVINPDNKMAMQTKAFTYFLGTVSFATATTISSADPLDRGPRSVVAVDVNGN